MALIAETRLTLAALLYAIEIDLKSIIKKEIIPYNGNLGFIGDDQLEIKVISRFERDNPGIEYLQNLDEVIEYIDFQDSFTILIKNKTFLSKDKADYLKSIFNKLSELTPIRNRVMHTRPLLGGDFAFTYDFVTSLRVSDSIEWANTIETRIKLEKDPSFVLTLKFPILDNSDSISITHNLPAPDFDETGFIGRIEDSEALTKLILSNKVVSVLGDGGIGKSALALKVAYDIVDMQEKCPFELVIWTSAKTTMLTSKGIEDIHTAITDYSGLVSEISTTLGTDSSTKLEQVLEYLSVFKTLLIIDNLETIQSDDVRDFIREAQTKCHIVITSRIGLGELEYPRKLKGLSETESAKMIREIARIRNSETLLKLPQKALVDISSKLYFNPLAIKWFVSTVETGIEPMEVINNKDDLLDFCLTNVYEKLSQGAISVLKTIRASRKKVTNAEIIYLSDLTPLEVRKYLIELFRTTLISRMIEDGNNYEDVIYYISDFAKDFLTKKYPIEQEYIKTNVRKSKELAIGINQIKKVQKYNIFALNALTYDNQNQMISAKFLQEALILSKAGKFKASLNKVNEAKNIDPNYFEVYRVSAFIKATQGDLMSAEEDYQLGLEISPDNIRLLFYYAQFLLFSLEDVDNALEYAKRVYEIKPEHSYTAFLYARCFNMAQEYNKAIQIIRSLKKTTELNAKNLRIANTELISYYGNIGKNEVYISSDIANGINHFKKAFEIFKDCIEESIVDYKMTKNFSVTLFNFLKATPKLKLQENGEYIKDLILKTNKFINLTIDLKTNILLKYQEKLEDESLNYLGQFENTGSELGNVIKQKDNPNFVFIETDSARYYANRYDFVDISGWPDWKNINDGQLVSFEIGENKLGKCAKKIKMLESNSA